MAGNGALSGTPTSADIGLNEFTVRVEDDEGLYDEVILQITVKAAGASGDLTETFNGSVVETIDTGGSNSENIVTRDYQWGAFVNSSTGTQKIQVMDDGALRFKDAPAGSYAYVDLGGSSDGLNNIKRGVST